MDRRATRILVACLILIIVVGCSKQIYNVKDAPIITVTGKEPSMEQVTKAIVEAGTRLNWTMAIVQPGHIVGTLPIRSHSAVVDIMYNTKTYSITYKDSTNLKYDAANQTIHNNYNGWVQNLDNAIKARLSAAGS